MESKVFLKKLGKGAPLISASVLGADPANLGADLIRVLNAGVWGAHWDVMDGHYVPNFSFGPHVIDRLMPQVNLFCDVHLMIENPEKWIHIFADVGAQSLTIHPKSVTGDVGKLLFQIKNLGMHAGIAVNPDEDPSVWPQEWWNLSDLALIMSVYPGYGGQNFLIESVKKIPVLKEKYGHLIFSVDGGINPVTAPIALEYGADILVSGSFLFNAPCLKKAAESLMIL